MYHKKESRAEWDNGAEMNWNDVSLMPGDGESMMLMGSLKYGQKAPWRKENPNVKSNGGIQDLKRDDNKPTLGQGGTNRLPLLTIHGIWRKWSLWFNSNAPSFSPPPTTLHYFWGSENLSYIKGISGKSEKFCGSIVRVGVKVKIEEAA